MFQKVFNEDLKTWTKKLETNDKVYAKRGWKTTIHQRKQTYMKTDMLRIDALMRNVDKAKFPEFFKNGIVEGGMVKEVTKLETMSNGDTILYFKKKIPLMTPRDSVCQIHTEDLPDGSTYINV
jgi:hypothetical protein